MERFHFYSKLVGELLYKFNRAYDARDGETGDKCLLQIQNLIDKQELMFVELMDPKRTIVTHGMIQKKYGLP